MRVARSSVREALRNEGLRRLGLTWTVSIASDAALTVVLLVTVFNRGGILAAALIGAIRMLPAVLVGMFATSLVERFRGDRVLIVVGIIRAVLSGLTCVIILTAGRTMADHDVLMIELFILAALTAAAAAPFRVSILTLMPAVARSPDELVAANTVWTTGEAVGAFAGPFVAGLLMAVNGHPFVALAAGAGFLVTSLIVVRLRFEQAGDATGGARAGGERARFRLADGIRAVRRNPLLKWTMFGVYGQVVTRGLLTALTVVAAIELLRMGQSGTGLLAAGLGLGGLIGSIFGMASRRAERLVRTQLISLVFWGLPMAWIGLLPSPNMAFFAMVVIGAANAAYDVALFTTLQRGASNDERGPVMSVLEVVIGLGAVSGSLLTPVLLFIGPRGGLIAAGLVLPLMVVVMYLRIGRLEKVTVVSESTVEVLRKVPAFAELPLTALERLADGLVPFSEPAGTALMTQGEPGDRFLVTRTGEIEVLVDGKPVQRLGPGAGVGEIALLRRSPRTATVVAVTDVTGFAVDAATFLAATAGPAACLVSERMVQANLARAKSKQVPAIQLQEA
jgi:MFS family permease